MRLSALAAAAALLFAITSANAAGIVDKFHGVMCSTPAAALAVFQDWDEEQSSIEDFIDDYNANNTDECKIASWAMERVGTVSKITTDYGPVVVYEYKSLGPEPTHHGFVIVPGTKSPSDMAPAGVNGA